MQERGPYLYLLKHTPWEMYKENPLSVFSLCCTLLSDVRDVKRKGKWWRYLFAIPASTTRLQRWSSSLLKVNKPQFSLPLHLLCKNNQATQKDFKKQAVCKKKKKTVCSTLCRWKGCQMTLTHVNTHVHMWEVVHWLGCPLSRAAASVQLWASVCTATRNPQHPHVTGITSRRWQLPFSSPPATRS